MLHVVKMFITVLESEISLLTHCEHFCIALTYGLAISFDKHHKENKNY